MVNSLLSAAITELKKKKYDAYYLSISNENLYEFTREIENYIVSLTGFTGDTGSLLITKNKCYLYVDGRFTVQAKREVKDKRIKIVEVNRNAKKLDDIVSRLSKNNVLALNPKKESANNVLSTIAECKKKNIKLVLDDKFLDGEFNEVKKNCFNLSSAPLFLLDKKSTSKNSKLKLKECIDLLKEDNALSGNIYYVTSNLEEIAYLTNLRYRFCDLDNYGVLFDAFLIVGVKNSTLYIKDYIEDKYLKDVDKSKIIIKEYKEFYRDIKKIGDKSKYYFDKRINNYYIYKCLNANGKNIINSPIETAMSLKGDTEIRNLRKCNILDGIAMTKVLYRLKNLNHNETKLKNEYDVQKFIDDTRIGVGKKNYLCPSFETIAAYKENAAICHYIPTKKNNKKLGTNGLLLLDSGGNYTIGTTDVTRTISLYKGKVPDTIKKHYTLVLDSMINLSIAKFPYGLTGFELDIIARKKLYDEFMDFNHGTGHGIGYISNVHEGPNRIGPGVNNNYRKNTLEPYQVTSNEPGLYFENKYGIRIENDLLTIPLKDNEFGDFMGFETLTLCPYDRDLIDKKYMSEESIKFLNNYNKLVYKKLSKYLTKDENNWLKQMTREV